MTPDQICQLLEDDYLKFLPVEGKLIAERREEDALVFLFEYSELLIEVFFSMDDGQLMGSSTLNDLKRLKPYCNHGSIGQANNTGDS